MLRKMQRKQGKKGLDRGRLDCPEEIFDIQTEFTNHSQLFLDAQMPLQLTPDQHFSAVGDAKLMATMPDSVELPYHPVQVRLKERLNQESTVKSPSNHDIIDSHEGEYERDLDVKVQSVKDFENFNLFDEHFSVSDLNNSQANVKGTLKENVTFWEQIGTGPWILNILRKEYSLPFVELPPKVFFKNNSSSVKSADFVTSEVFKLLELGCIREIAKEEAHVISPLSVVDNDHKLRLILDLSFVNKFLSVPKFHYEDIRTLKDLFQKGDYFFKFDIKSGYHHLDINKADQKFLAFSWEINGVSRYFVFIV